jgi:hypothetical protein
MGRSGTGISRPLYIGLVAAQWLLLTVALASVYVHASAAIRDYVTPGISDAYLLLGPFLLAGLLGATVASLRLLLALVFLMVLVAASIFGAVLYAPGWLNITARTVALQNFATQQALFLILWTIIPAFTGGVIGHLLGGSLRRDTLRSESEALAPWWDGRDTRRTTPNDDLDVQPMEVVDEPK